MKIAWVEWQTIKIVLIGPRSCEKLKLLTLKRVLETQPNFNFKPKNQGKNLQNHKGLNNDYLIFNNIANYHQWAQVLQEVLNQTYCLLQLLALTWWEVLMELIIKFHSLENFIAVIISDSTPNAPPYSSQYK